MYGRRWRRSRGSDDRGLLDLNGRLPFDWPPDPHRGIADPRKNIKLRDGLHMSSGLYPVDTIKGSPSIGSHRKVRDVENRMPVLMLWAVVAAEVLGFENDESLTLERAAAVDWEASRETGGASGL